MNVTQNKWQNKEWECYKDPMNALYGWCCPMCMVCTNAKDLGENLGLFCILGFCCFPCGVYLLRKKAREVYGIEGEMVEDAAWSCCCSACINCQIANENKTRKM